MLTNDQVRWSTVGGGGHLPGLDDAQRRGDGDPTVQRWMGCGESNVCAEGPSDESNRRLRTPLGGQVDGGQDVESLPVAVIVPSVGTLNASEVESECRYPDGREHPEETVDDGGMHVAAV